MGKMEVILRTERRRKWTEQDRQRILADCDEPGVTIREVCERHQIAESLIYGWRAERRQKIAQVVEPLRFIDCGAIPADEAPVHPLSAAPANLLPAKPKRVQPIAAPVDNEMPTPPDNRLGLIEVQLPTGERLAVDSFVNEKALARVLRTLRDVR
jgi:transposase